MFRGVKEMTSQQVSVKDIKEYYLKRLQKLSEDSLGAIPQLEEPTYEQKEWVLRKVKRRFR